MNKKTLEELINAFWDGRVIFHVSQQIDKEIYRVANDTALAEIIGNVNNFSDIERARKFADRMFLSADANRAYTKKQINEQAKAIQTKLDQLETIFKNTGTNYDLLNMLKGNAISSLITKLTGISAGTAGEGGAGSVGAGGSGLGIVLLVLSLGASSEKAQAQEASPDPRIFRYQQYLIQWLMYAIKTLKSNGGKLNSVNKPKTFEKWLATPTI